MSLLLNVNNNVTKNVTNTITKVTNVKRHYMPSII